MTKTPKEKRTHAPKLDDDIPDNRGSGMSYMSQYESVEIENRMRKRGML